MNENLITLLMHIFGGISFLCSVILLVIYLVHKPLRSSIYNEIIFYIGICDMLSSIGGGLGLVRENTALCQIQAILTNIFPISGIFWTSLLVYILVGVVANKRLLKNIDWKLHVIGWGFPIIISLLPLTTNRYGVPGDDRGWCFIDRLDNSPSWSTLFWMITSFYIWIWASEILFALFILYLIYIIYIKKISLSPGRSYTITSLFLYPISSFVCWILPCYSDIFWSYSHQFIYHEENATTSLGYLTPLFQGMLTFLIFIFMNHDVLYQLIQAIDTIIRIVSCGRFLNPLSGCLMRFHSSHEGVAAAHAVNDQNNLIRDHEMSDDHFSRNRFDQESNSTEYEIKGTVKNSFDSCSIVIC